MELEKQVCSLELAKKLKELGVEQESLWYWCENKANKYYIPVKPITFEKASANGWSIPFSAYTVAELGELLPEEYKTIKKNDIWQCYFPIGTTVDISYTTEANARAKMLIYLIEQKLLQPHH